MGNKNDDKRKIKEKRGKIPGYLKHWLSASDSPRPREHSPSCPTGAARIRLPPSHRDSQGPRKSDSRNPSNSPSSRAPGSLPWHRLCCRRRGSNLTSACLCLINLQYIPTFKERKRRKEKKREEKRRKEKKREERRERRDGNKKQKILAFDATAVCSSVFEGFASTCLSSLEICSTICLIWIECCLTMSSMILNVTRTTCYFI